MIGTAIQLFLTDRCNLSIPFRSFYICSTQVYKTDLQGLRKNKICIDWCRGNIVFLKFTEFILMKYLFFFFFFFKIKASITRVLIKEKKKTF
jgi:hypothetical protein